MDNNQSEIDICSEQSDIEICTEETVWNCDTSDGNINLTIKYNEMNVEEIIDQINFEEIKDIDKLEQIYELFTSRMYYLNSCLPFGDDITKRRISSEFDILDLKRYECQEALTDANIKRK